MTRPYLCDSPPFDEAVSVLRNFLKQQGVSDNVHWLWRDAIISRRSPGSQKSANRRIFVDWHGLADDESIRKYYDVGVERRLGIALRVFCLAGDVPLCFIYVPEDETAAEYAMMSALKCSIPIPCPQATIVKHWLMAAVMRMFIRVPKTAWITNEVPVYPDYSRRQRRAEIG
jgi:hypothetical protein